MASLDNEDAQYATVAMGLVNVAMIMASLVLVEEPEGRPSSYQVSREKSIVILYFSTALIMLFVIFVAIGPGSIPWFLVTELFSQSACPVAISIAVAVKWTTNFIVGLEFLPMQGLLKSYVFITFTILLVAFSIFIKFTMPETKNESTGEISASFRQLSYN